MRFFLLLFAATIHLEAGNQGTHGMELVADVINNRVYEECMEGYGVESAYLGVILESKQFSCWNADSGNRIPDVYRMDQRCELEEEKRIAQEHLGLLYDTLLEPIYRKELPDGTALNLSRVPFKYTSATHYHTTNVHPPWDKKMQEVDRYRDHIFYKP